MNVHTLFSYLLVKITKHDINIDTQYGSKDIGRCGVSANETTLHPNNNFKKNN